MQLKGQSLDKWEEWLKVQITQNPDNLKNDEKYVLEAFLELIVELKNKPKQIELESISTES